MQQHTAEPVGLATPQKVEILCPFRRTVTVEPHPLRDGWVVVHVLSSDSKPMAFFELDAALSSQFVCAVMDGIAATTVRKQPVAPRLRAPRHGDGESPFFPVPGLSSAGEY